MEKLLTAEGLKSRLNLSFSCIFSCSQVRARKYDSAQLSRADSLKAVDRLCSFSTQPSFDQTDQTDDGVDAETSLSLSLHLYLSYSRSPLVNKTLFENACELE